jgi:hypothetical protein
MTIIPVTAGQTSLAALQTPVTGNQTPVTGVQTPVTDAQTPVTGVQMPMHGGQTPETVLQPAVTDIIIVVISIRIILYVRICGMTS